MNAILRMRTSRIWEEARSPACRMRCYVAWIGLVSGILHGCSASAVVSSYKVASLQQLSELGRESAARLLDVAQTSTAIVATSSSPDAQGFDGWSSAVPVSADGYYLTSAHGVEGNRTLKVISIDKDETVVVADARVAWKGVGREPDFAVLHVLTDSWTHMKVEEFATPEPQTLVVASGWSSMDNQTQEVPTRSLAAGRVISVSQLLENASNPGCRYREVVHSAPCSAGDSGGPILNSKGLVGIQSHGVFSGAFVWQRFRCLFGSRGLPLTGYHAVAYAPDPLWLREAIAEDRVRNRR